MYRLTDRRKAKALPILQRHKAKLDETGSIRVHELEKKLCACWNVGYRRLKDIIEDMSKCDEYMYLAAYYMEKSNAGAGVVCEFQPVLAKLYGIKWYFDDNRSIAREAFWANHNEMNK